MIIPGVMAVTKPRPSGRYWRILFPAFNGYVATREIEFRSVTSASTAAGTEQATGGTAIGDPYYYNRGGNDLQPARAFDGTFGPTGPDDRWSTDTNGTYDRWIGYDFGSPIAVVQLAVCGSGVADQDFDEYSSTSYLERSEDGTTWTPVKSFTSATWGTFTASAFNLYSVP